MLVADKGVFEQVRALIAADDLPAAFAMVKVLFEGTSERDQVILLEAQYSHWERLHKIDWEYPTTDRNRLSYAFLTLLTEMELRISPGIVKQKQLEIERMLERSFSQMAVLEKPFAQTDELLCKLQSTSPALFNQLKGLSAELYRTNGKMADAAALIQFWLQSVAATGAFSASAQQLFSHLLSSNPGALLSLMNERRHKESEIKVLEKQIEQYKLRYEKIKTAGIAGLAGVFLGAAFSNWSGLSIFGHRYDQHGYDLKGFDADGFNKCGFNVHGHHFIEGYGVSDFAHLLPIDVLIPDFDDQHHTDISH
jgi:hypothetical protein